MKMTLLLSLLSLSGIVMAQDLSGLEAAQKFESIVGFESSSIVRVTGLEVRLTTRHDKEISCEKEETIYSNSNEVEVEYRCSAIVAE